MNEGIRRYKKDRGKESPSREELLASYRDLASILESMLDPVIVANPDGTIRTVNPATLGLLGYTEEEVLGKPVGTIFEEDFFRGTGLARLVYEGVARDVEVTLRAKSGERIPVVFNGSVIREEDGRLIAVVGVVRDIRERLRTEKTLKRRATQLQTLSEVGREIASLLELAPLLNRIVNLIHEAFNYPYVTIFLIDQATGELVLQAGTGYKVEHAKAVRLRVGEKSICGWVAGSGEPLLVNNVSQESRYYPLEVLADTRAELGVPIRARGEVIGVLDVQSPELEAFNEDDLFTLRMVADQVGVAIENARLFDMERQRSAQLAAVSEVARKIAAILNLDELLRETVELIIQTFGYYYAAIMLVDTETDELVFKVGAGGYSGMTPVGYRQKMRKGMIGWSAYLGEPLWANDVSQEPRYIPAYLSTTKSELDVPLKHRGKVIGVLDLQSKELNAFSQHDVMAMEALAGQIAIAIENARLYTERQRRITALATINQIGKSLSSTLEFDALLELIYRQVNQVMDAENLYIALYDEEKDEVSFPLYYELGKPIKRSSRHGKSGLTEYIIRTKKPLLFSNTSNDEYAGRLKQLGITELFGEPAKSWLGVPMIVGDRVIGVIGVQSYTEERIYDKEHLELLSTIASQAAIAIENARLFGETEHLRAFNENIVKGVGEAILIEDAGGIFTFANQAAEELLGYSREELIGIHWSALIPEDQMEKVRKEVEKRPQGIKSRYEASLLRKDKARIPVIVSARPLFEGDKFVGVLSALTDITERVQAEGALRRRFVDMAEMVSRVFSLRDPYVAAHQNGTAQLARAVGAKMGLDEGKLQALYIGSLLHDVGKAAIPEGILRKPGKLAEEEWGLVRTHPQRGYEVLKNTNLPWPVAELALHHHERLDGSGYPDGLKGDELCLEVRILAVCNVVDAMSARRPWRPARTKQEIVQELKKGKGVKYDPTVVEVILEMIESGEWELRE